MGSQSWTQLSDWTITTNGIQSHHFMVNWRGKSGSSYILQTLRTVAPQAPPSMGFSRQEYWSELPFPSFSRGSSRPRNWTCISCIAGRFFTTEPPGKRLEWIVCRKTNCQRCFQLSLTKILNIWQKIKLDGILIVFRILYSIDQWSTDASAILTHLILKHDISLIYSVLLNYPSNIRWFSVYRSYTYFIRFMS